MDAADSMDLTDSDFNPHLDHLGYFKNADYYYYCYYWQLWYNCKNLHIVLSLLVIAEVVVFCISYLYFKLAVT